MVKRDENFKTSVVMEATKSFDVLPNQEELLTLQSSSGTNPNSQNKRLASSPEVITISSDDEEENGLNEIKNRKRFKKWNRKIRFQ